MPRVPISLVRQAKSIHSLLPLLLGPCRSIESAHSELRWLSEYQKKLATTVAQSSRRDRQKKLQAPLLRDLCLERSRGKPLQYILGTQPFGELEIMCRRGVLIPRPETEAYVDRLASMIMNYDSVAANKKGQRTVRILDVGTGTGCIALLLVSRLWRKYHLRITAIDICPKAIQLARRNMRNLIKTGALPINAASMINIIQHDFCGPDMKNLLEWQNFLICNPPYISEADLRSKSERSVRLYEPRTALIAKTAELSGLTIYEQALRKWVVEAYRKADVCLIEFMEEQRAYDFIAAVKSRRHEKAQSEKLSSSAEQPASHQSLVRFEIWRENVGPNERSEALSSSNIQPERWLDDCAISQYGTGRIIAVLSYSTPKRLDVLGFPTVQLTGNPPGVTQTSKFNTDIRSYSEEVAKDAKISSSAIEKPELVDAALKGVDLLQKIAKEQLRRNEEFTAEQTQLWQAMQTLIQETSRLKTQSDGLQAHIDSLNAALARQRQK